MLSIVVLNACAPQEHVHNYVYVIVENPTCKEKGKMEGICSSCGNKDYQELNTIGHEYGEWEETVKPTCKEKGKEERVCKHCDEKEQREKDIIDHEYAWSITKQPTCKEKGIASGTCLHCYNETTRDIKENGHKFENSICTECFEIEGVVQMPEGQELGVTADFINQELQKVNTKFENLIYAQINRLTISQNGGITLDVTDSASGFNFSFNYNFLREDFVMEQGITDVILSVNIIAKPVKNETDGAIKILDSYYHLILEITYVDGEKLQVGTFGVENAQVTSIAINMQNEFLTVSSTGKVTKYGTISSENVAVDKSVLIYRKISDTEYAVEGVYDTEVENIVIPATHKGLKVTQISENAFNRNKKIISLTIGKNIKKINEKAFYSCSNLSDVTFEQGSELESIGDFAFYQCYSLKSIEIPSSVISIGGSSFNNCSNLTTVAFEENCKLEIINRCAFAYCDLIANIEIPASVISIDDHAFLMCDNLRTVIFDTNSQLKFIKSRAFYECTLLKSIEIPANVTNIGDYAFFKCDNLRTITFEVNSKLEFIGNAVFKGCALLKSIEIPASVTKIGDGVFIDCSELKEIIFEDATTWYVINKFYNNAVNNWNNKTGGNKIDVSDDQQNKTNFNSTYTNCYWYKT